MKAVVIALFLSLCSLATSVAQDAPPPRESPLAIITAHYKNTYLKITYCQPQKKGREIFGKLVPFDQVWRTGANEATEVTITQDIIVNGTTLKAGTYSLFTVPGKEKWTIIFNSDLGLWGSYNYNPKMDVVRFDAAVTNTLNDLVSESFPIRIDQKTATAQIFLMWDKTQVSFPIQFIEPKP